MTPMYKIRSRKGVSNIAPLFLHIIKWSKFYPCLIRPNTDNNNHQVTILSNFSKAGFFLTWQFSVDLCTLTASKASGNPFFCSLHLHCVPAICVLHSNICDKTKKNFYVYWAILGSSQSFSNTSLL